MKKTSLILVSIHIKDSPQAVPLAAASLKAQLDSVPSISQRLDVSFKDYTVDHSADFITEDLCKNIPDMIGFSTYLWNRQLVVDACRIIKGKFPAVKLFAGGAEATALPLMLLDCAPFDFVIKGEGEIVLTEVMNRVLKGETLEDIPGVFVKGAKLKPGKDQQPVMDLEFPALAISHRNTLIPAGIPVCYGNSPAAVLLNAVSVSNHGVWPV